MKPTELLHSNAVIIDTETTGVDTKAQIIQLAAIDMQGKTLFDSLFRPSVPIHPKSAETHHLTIGRLRNAPQITEVIEKVRDILIGRPVIIYNVSFDKRMLRQTLEGFSLDTTWLDTLNYQCAMRLYAEHLGVKNSPKLEGGDHTALGDCLATLKLLRSIAGTDTPKPKVCDKYIGPLCPPPSPRMLKWIKAALAAQEQRSGQPAPLHFHEYISMAERANSQPIEIEITNDADWERFYATAFKEE
jgi:DNA polymerase-3 subunit epsilon